MKKPTKCQWCGCGDVDRQSHFLYSVLTTFACGTLCETLVGETRWFRDAQCAGKVGQAYKRIERAIEALKQSPRVRLEEDQYGKWMKGVDDGRWIEWTSVENVIRILEGEEK